MATLNTLDRAVHAQFIASLKDELSARSPVVHAVTLACLRVLRAKSPAARARARQVYADVLAGEMRAWLQRTGRRS